jgi:thymidylate synthase
MYQNWIQPDISHALPHLCSALMAHGQENGSRNGTVKELTHVGITLAHPNNREILLDSRKANLAAQIAETMWVLSGRDDMDFLSKYLPRATDYSDDGKVWRGAYGPRLRAYYGTTDGYDRQPIVDQWAHCLNLLRRDPLTRRAVITIYDPAIDTEDGKDIPCNNWITFSSRLGRLDMHVGIRSNDLLWGWSGINAFEWSAMLEISAALLGVEVGALHFSTTSLHLYAPHWAKAEKIAADEVPTGLEPSPRFWLPLESGLANFDMVADEWFMAERLIREHPGSTAANEAVDSFPEPMLQSWLRVLQWWWTGDHAYLKPLAGTRLEYATHVSVQPPSRKPETLPGLSVAQAMTAAQRLAATLIHGGHTNRVRDALKEVGGSSVSALSPEQVEEFMRTVEQPEAVIVDGEVTPLPNVDVAGRDAALERHGQQHGSDFIRFAIRTHNEKHAAYGDSWKRRGEMLGIMANIARKVDRLGGAETSDETSADTAMDLMVYLAKYATWIEDQETGETSSDTTDAANVLLLETDRLLFDTLNGPAVAGYAEGLEAGLRDGFDHLEFLVTEGLPDKDRQVRGMLQDAYRLAIYLHGRQQKRAAARDAALRNTPDPDGYRGADRD